MRLMAMGRPITPTPINPTAADWVMFASLCLTSVLN
jgi:hypothetical protein